MRRRPVILRLTALVALLFTASCGSMPRPASSLAEQDRILAQLSSREQRAALAALKTHLRSRSQLVHRQAAAAARFAHTLPAEFPLELPLDPATLAVSDVGKELSRRYLQAAFARHGILLPSPYAERILARCRWSLFVSERGLSAEIARAQAVHKPLLYRGRQLERALRAYNCHP